MRLRLRMITATIVTTAVTMTVIVGGTSTEDEAGTGTAAGMQGGRRSMALALARLGPATGTEKGRDTEIAIETGTGLQAARDTPVQAQAQAPQQPLQQRSLSLRMLCPGPSSLRSIA